MHFSEIADRLKGKLFLSSMMGRGDGAFCAARAGNCAMVQLGAFVLLAEREERNVYWPEPDKGSLVTFMRDQFDTCRGASAEIAGDDAIPVVSANVFPCTDEDVTMSAEAFIEAGGDIYELNAHGGIGGDRERGTGAMLFISEHTPKLMRWAKLLVDAGGPVIIKGKANAVPDFTDHVKRLEGIGVHSFHINVRNEDDGTQNLKVLDRIRAATGMFLLTSGFVKDAATAATLFDSGADCVGIAQIAIDTPDIFTTIQ